jgi:septal ring factor EnvC (AmiA/AmiB activator)
MELDEEMLATNSPVGTFVGEDYDSLKSKTTEQLQSFNDLLETLAPTEDKQKALWRQIYENAITDRMNAYIIWIDLYKEVANKPSEHAIHGQNLSRYLERMSKANDQLLKLVELVGDARKKDTSEVSEDAIYQEMENNSRH